MSAGGRSKSTAWFSQEQRSFPSFSNSKISETWPVFFSSVTRKGRVDPFPGVERDVSVLRKDFRRFRDTRPSGPRALARGPCCDPIDRPLCTIRASREPRERERADALPSRRGSSLLKFLERVGVVKLGWICGYLSGHTIPHKLALKFRNEVEPANLGLDQPRRRARALQGPISPRLERIYLKQNFQRTRVVFFFFAFFAFFFFFFFFFFFKRERESWGPLCSLAAFALR